MIEANVVGISEGLILLGIAGEIQSGKDTLSAIEAEYYRAQGADVEIRSTSSVIKNFAETGMGKRQLAKLEQEKGIIPYDMQGNVSRRALLHLGYSLQEKYGDDCLTATLINEANRKHQQGTLDVFILNGIRRAKEADLLRKLGVELQWIDINHIRSFHRNEALSEMYNLGKFLERIEEEKAEMMQIRDRRTYLFNNNGKIEDLRSQAMDYFIYRQFISHPTPV